MNAAIHRVIMGHAPTPLDLSNVNVRLRMPWFQMMTTHIGVKVSNAI